MATAIAICRTGEGGGCWVVGATPSDAREALLVARDRQRRRFTFGDTARAIDLLVDAMGEIERETERARGGGGKISTG